MLRKLLTGSTALVCMFAYSDVHANSMSYASLEELFGEPVTLSANGSPQRERDVSLSMEILTAKEIEATGARSLPEVLRFLPGVDVRQYSYGQTEVAIRGYNQPAVERILVLLNGRQVYTDFYGQVVWDSIPVSMNEIQQIEVVKGPNTALFGFNAVSGVINIVTTNPMHSDAKELDVRVGSNGLREVQGFVNHRVSDSVSVRVSAGGYETSGDFDDTEATTSPSGFVEPDSRYYVADTWVEISDYTKAQFEVTNSNTSTNTVLPTRSEISTGLYETDSVRAHLVSDTDYGVIEADIYHNITDARITIQGTRLEIDNHVTVAKLTNTFEAATDHIVRLGTEYRKASNHADTPTGALDQGDLSYDVMSASGLWHWKADEKWSTSAAVRYDHFRLEPDGNFVSPAIRNGYTAFGFTAPFTDDDFHQEFREISYTLGGVYKPDEMQAIRLSTARGVDLPSFTEFGVQFLNPDADGNPADPTSSAGSVLGSPNTTASIVTNYELSYDLKFPESDALMRTAIFYQKNEDMQSFPAQFTDRVTFDESIFGNVGDSTMYGFELGFNGEINDAWTWFANYSYVEVDDNFVTFARPNNAVASIANFEEEVSNHIVSGHLGYNATDWRANIFAQYKTPFDELFSSRTSSNNSNALYKANDTLHVNANIAYDISEDITWYVSGSSLQGTSAQTGVVDAEASVWSGINWRF